MSTNGGFMSGNYKTIDVFTLFKSLVNKWWIIFICVLLGGLAAFARDLYLVTPMYESETIMFIGRKEESIDFNYGSFALSEKLIADYRELIETNQVLRAIKKELDLEISTDNLREQITVDTETGARFMRVNVRYDDPDLAAEISNRLSEVLKDEALRIIGIENITIIDHAIPDNETVSPRIYRDTFIGMVIGAMISAYIISLRYVVTLKIVDLKMLQDYVELPILGTVSHSKKTSHQREIKDKYDSLLMGIGPRKILMITSPEYNILNNEVAIKLSEAYASYNKRVLLIDGIIRKPTINEYYKVNLTKGLSDALANPKMLVNYVKPVKPMIDVLTTGYYPRRVEEIFNKEIIGSFIKEVKEAYDVIIIIGPPPQDFAESLLYSRVSDYVIICAYRYKTGIENLSDCVKTLKRIEEEEISILFDA